MDDNSWDNLQNWEGGRRWVPHVHPTSTATIVWRAFVLFHFAFIWAMLYYIVDKVVH